MGETATTTCVGVVRAEAKVARSARTGTRAETSIVDRCFSLGLSM